MSFAGARPGTYWYEMLSRGDARELREKVGVTSPADGSAKGSVRLLGVDDWIFKLDLARSARSREAQVTAARGLQADARKYGLWHPEKTYLVYRTGDRWHVVSGCPRLQTLRELREWPELKAAWLRMLELGLRSGERLGIGLDLNPANFGLDRDGKLFYLDDETYTDAPVPRDLGESVVARVPEYPRIREEQWRAWGKSIARDLAHRFDREGWEQLRAAVGDYPVVAAFRNKRRALLEGLVLPTRLLRQRRGWGGKALVFADVHGNLPALDAVLEAGARMGVDSHLFLGDVVGYGPHPRECIQRLAELPDAVLIQGNHDRAVATGETQEGVRSSAAQTVQWTHDLLSVEEREWLADLPRSEAREHWMALHGAPIDVHKMYAYVYDLTYVENLDYLSERGTAVCFHGHTHVQYVYWRSAIGEVAQGRLETFHIERPAGAALVNPGSVGQPRDFDPRAAFAVWDVSGDYLSFHRTVYPIEETVRAIRKTGLPERLALRLQKGA